MLSNAFSFSEIAQNLHQNSRNRRRIYMQNIYKEYAIPSGMEGRIIFAGLNFGQKEPNF